MVAKFPSFKSEWKEIHEIKYGLNKQLYNNFKFLIQDSKPNTGYRDTVIKLLSEWLCAYHETVLIKTAQRKAQKLSKDLVYINQEGLLSLEPDNGNLFAQGELNKTVRDDVHCKRNFRKQLAEDLHNKKYKKQEEYLEHKVLELPTVFKIAKSILKDEEKLLSITKEDKDKIDKVNKCIQKELNQNFWQTKIKSEKKEVIRRKK